MVAPEEAAIEILMVYGSEKQAWIEAVVPEFERWYYEETGVKVRVVCIPMGSGKSMSQILLGQIEPTVWSPACSIWIPLMNYLWNMDYPEVVAERGPIVREWVPLVISPLVMITWEEYQARWDLTGLRSLHELATSEEGGELKFAHTDPSMSNSGLMSVLLELVVAVNETGPGKRPEDITLTDMARPEVKAWISALEARAVGYPSSTGWLVSNMLSEGPGKINVVLAYENLVIEANKGAGGRVLVAIYPREGTFLSDHPFCILNAPWVRPEQEEVARALRSFLLSYEIQEKAVHYGFRPSNANVPLDPSVFNEDLGVKAELPCRVLSTDVKGEVILLLPDLWLACRPRG